MANRCSIDVYISLESIPDKREREQFTTLYEAERKWKEVVKKRDRPRTEKDHQEFIASRQGVPFRRTEWRYHFNDEEVKQGKAKDGELRPESEQWNQPTVSAHFEERGGCVWVHPFRFDRGSGLLFDDGITICPFGSKHQYAHLPMDWGFKWFFPWWAQIGFAGAKKYCDQESKDAPEGQTAEFYDKWYERHGQLTPYLIWENPVSKILKNLRRAGMVLENFPVTEPAWQWGWVWEELNQLKGIYGWFEQIHAICSEAIAKLDWEEVAWNLMTYEEARKNDEPNELVTGVEEMEKDIDRLRNGRISQTKFKKKYALDLQERNKGWEGT